MFSARCIKPKHNPTNQQGRTEQRRSHISLQRDCDGMTERIPLNRARGIEQSEDAADQTKPQHHYRDNFHRARRTGVGSRVAWEIFFMG
jgi:hypothetical protein